MPENRNSWTSIHTSNMWFGVFNFTLVKGKDWWLKVVTAPNSQGLSSYLKMARFTLSCDCPSQRCFSQGPKHFNFFIASLWRAQMCSQHHSPWQMAMYWLKSLSPPGGTGAQWWGPYWKLWRMGEPEDPFLNLKGGLIMLAEDVAFSWSKESQPVKDESLWYWIIKYSPYLKIDFSMSFASHCCVPQPSLCTQADHVN